MNKKEFLVGLFSGFLANTVGAILTVVLLFQEVKISNISKIISDSISDNYITKLISLGAIINLFVFLCTRYEFLCI